MVERGKIVSQPRMNRLFRGDGRCLEIALDHGAYNEPAFLCRVLLVRRDFIVRNSFPIIGKTWLEDGG